MVDESYLKQLGIGVASLTFGAALSIFIYAVASGAVNSIQAWLLFFATFLLMLRFWWRYTELFVQFLPSKGFYHFLLDFAISFFGIIAVLFVQSIQTWAAVGAGAMMFSLLRCSLSWAEAKSENVKIALRKTVFGSITMLIIMSAVYLAAPVFDNLLLAGAVLMLVVVFLAYTSGKG
jgi:hypothetical protein